MPTVAAVHGLCLGAALSVIASCDLVLAAESARFGLPEGRIGLVGATPLVPIVGRQWAKFLMFTGENISAAVARDIGLVLTVERDDELFARADELARRLARLPREALLLNKRAVDAVADAAGDAAGRVAGLSGDAMTLANSARANAPDGRAFRDIIATEGMDGLKAARRAQYDEAVASMTTETLGTSVLHELRDGISTITLNRPDAANAVLPEMRDTIIDLLAAADPDPAVRVVAIRANGRHFCSGADVGSIAAGAREGGPLVGDGMRRIMQGAQRLVAAVLDCPKPVLAVVQGTAAGLGAHLAYACDLVVASEAASFLEPFLSRGLVVDAGGTYLLPRLVGMQRAKELMFLAERLQPEQAREMGLVNRVVPAAELDQAADELLTKLAGMPTSALGFTKRLVNATFESDRAETFLAEAAFQELQSHSHDAHEGVTSFLERRPA